MVQEYHSPDGEYSWWHLKKGSWVYLNRSRKDRVHASLAAHLVPGTTDGMVREYGMASWGGGGGSGNATRGTESERGGSHAQNKRAHCRP